MEMDLSWLEIIGLLAITVVGVLLTIAFVSWASLSFWQYKRYNLKKKVCDNIRFFQTSGMDRNTQIWYAHSTLKDSKDYCVHTKREAEGMLISWGLLGKSIYVCKSSDGNSNVSTLEDPICVQENI